LIEDAKSILPANCEDTGPYLNELFDEMSSSEVCELLRDNLVSFSSARKEQTVRPSTYIKIVKYCTFKLQGLSDEEAFKSAFPGRYLHYQKNGLMPQLASKIRFIARHPITAKILTIQSLGDHILFSNERYEMIMGTLELARNQNASDFMRQQARSKIIDITAKPEIRSNDTNDDNKPDIVVQLMNSIQVKNSTDAKLIESGHKSLSEILNGE